MAAGGGVGGDGREAERGRRACRERRMEGVMKLGKAKAQLLGKEGEGFSMMRFLGRLRYPVK